VKSLGIVCGNGSIILLTISFISAALLGPTPSSPFFWVSVTAIIIGATNAVMEVTAVLIVVTVAGLSGVTILIICDIIFLF